jgi:hypothetical protein
MLRQAIVLASLAVGLALALALVGQVGTFQNTPRHPPAIAHQSHPARA